MDKFFVIFVVIAGFCFSEAQEVHQNTTSNNTTSAPVKPPHVYNVICYYNKLSQNRSDSNKYTVSDVDSTLCSHVIYSYATLDPVSLKIKNDSLGEDYENVIALKSKGIKVMLSLGGKIDSLESEKYSRMVQNGTARNEFVDSTVRFLREHKFDGLDLNWDYPTCWNGNCKGGRPGDRGNFVNLLKELHVAFHFYKLQLSVAVSPLSEIANQAYDVAGIARHVDLINLMTFDYNNETYTNTAIHAPFKGTPPNTVSTVEYWMSKGAPAEKLVIGIPTFGRTFTLAKEQWTAPNSPAVIGKPTGLNEAGLTAYYEVCTGLDYQLVENVGPYAFKGDQWVSFDDVTSIKQKGEYIHKMELGGGMIFTLDTDDFTGTMCGQGKYPLIKALRQGLGLETKETEPTTTTAAPAAQNQTTNQ